VSTETIVYVLTALAALVVVLTRLRLRGDGGAGRVFVGRALLNLHTVAGVLALLAWVVFLLGGDLFSDSTENIIGIAALALWWLVALAGLLILVRWLPSRGRHAASGQQDTWSDGPGLSVLAHLGMVAGVGVFTWAYVMSKV
jgi:drug/metabolite transporter (DMT)-like permease